MPHERLTWISKMLWQGCKERLVLHVWLVLVMMLLLLLWRC